MPPIRVFVGCAANGEDAESLMVLEYSIRKHTRAHVQIFWLKQAANQSSMWHGWNTSRWATPFSGLRWSIPAYCSFMGRAIYLDSDTIVLTDIAELWNMEMKPGKVVASKGGWRFCVSLWDCAAAQEHMIPLNRLKSGADSHSVMVQRFRQRHDLIQAFDKNWNYCDNEDYGPLSEAKILHYTDMSSQPHLKYALPRLAESGRKHWFNGKTVPHRRPEIQELFDAHYNEALAAGCSVADYVPAEPFAYGPKADLSNYRGRA